jgi:hypothetical protein
MTSILKVQAIWTGFIGAPGYTTHYFDGAALTIPAQMRVFFDAIKATLPPVVVVAPQNSGMIIEDSTGEAVGIWSQAAAATVTGTGSGAYSAPSGAVVDWKTDDFVNGRHVQGRSFLVPLSGGAFQTDGTILGTQLTILQNAAAAYVAGAGGLLLVWHRPVDGAGGSSHAVTSALVPDKSCVLRSRRD